MKKILVSLIALVMVIGLAACTVNGDPGTTEEPGNATQAPAENTEAPAENTEAPAENTEAPAEDINAKSEGVMTYAEYDAAAIDAEVTIEAYVQAHQSWWDDKITVYAADGDGAYFMYDMKCAEADADKLTPGTKIRVHGYKAEWSGEIEIVDGTFEILEGNYIAPAVDVTDLLGTDELIKKQNQFVSFKGLTVVAKKLKDDDTEYAFMYKWDNSGEQGDDVYFDVKLGENTYTFLVESYLCGKDTDVYKAVEGLKVGDVVDLEGFLYWYNGVNPHITSVIVK
ncbi:MAG: hypothetical protein ILO53_07515 [Clostridia bacterium]|nr:hypothetical protein [Clostridia bacterium]